MIKKTLIWIGTAIGAGAVMPLIFNILNRPNVPQTIAINGECLTTVQKDTTAITLRVATLAPSALESMQMASEKMSEINEYLKLQLVETQTTQFNSFEKNEWNRETQKSVPVGIETNFAVEISAKNINVIEDIISKFVGQPNIFAENLRTYTSPAVVKQAQEKCLGIALENARKRANATLSGDNKQAGKLISVSCGTISNDINKPHDPVMRTMLSGATLESFDMANTIKTKDTDVSVVINAVFEID